MTYGQKENAQTYSLSKCNNDTCYAVSLYIITDNQVYDSGQDIDGSLKLINYTNDTMDISMGLIYDYIALIPNFNKIEKNKYFDFLYQYQYAKLDSYDDFSYYPKGFVFRIHENNVCLNKGINMIILDEIKK